MSFEDACLECGSQMTVVQSIVQHRMYLRVQGAHPTSSSCRTAHLPPPQEA